MNCCTTVYLCVCVILSRSWCMRVQVVSCLNLWHKASWHPSLNTLCNADDFLYTVNDFFLSSVRLYLLRLRCCSLHKYLPLMASKWMDFSVSKKDFTHVTAKQIFIKRLIFFFLFFFSFTDIMTLECWCFKSNLRHPDCHKAQCLKSVPTAASGQPIHGETPKPRDQYLKKKHNDDKNNSRRLKSRQQGKKHRN